MTEEVDINTTIHEDNLGIIVDRLSVSIFFFKKNSAYRLNLVIQT